MTLPHRMKIFAAQAAWWYRRQNRWLRLSLPLLAASLVLIFSLALCGPYRLGLLASGDQAIFRNLPVLWNGDPLKVHIIDVGQGDASLIQADGTAILIDSGPPEAAVDLLAYLRAAGIRRLDLLILTHPHDDHLGGALLLLEKMPVAAVMMAHADNGNALQRAIRSRAGQLRIPVSSPFAGTRVSVGSLRLDCLHPKAQTYANVNNYSSVWELTHGASRWLFLADLEKDQFGVLPQLPIAFLRSGHHGSETSFDPATLKVLSPQLVAISCGAGNAFGHPDKGLVQWLEIAQIPCLRTDRQGTRVISSDGKSLRWVH